MPELFLFLLKVNIALVLFCLGYYLVLRKLTFYTLNRVYLIVAIISSSAYPLIDVSAFAQRHREIVAPVQNAVIIWKAPVQQMIERAAYWNWLEALFWTGVIILAMRLMSQLFSLYRIYRRSAEREINGQKVRVVNADIGPFSFWKSIYLNPNNLSPSDLQNILDHEQIHVSEWHTLDILLTEISVIFYWFNPGIWIIKKAVRENIEFITDRKILQKGTDSKAYQYSLLSITFNQPAPVAITNNFNFSTLKKRIMMMNAKRSSNINLTRYAFLVPVVLVCLFAFSLSKAEVVKTSPVYKSIAKTVQRLNGMVLRADTTPNPKRVTNTISIRTDTTGRTKKIIYVTSTEKDLQGTKFIIDTKLDTLRRTGGTFSLNIRNSINADTVTTIMINGKKGTIEDLKKLNITSTSGVTGLRGFREFIVVDKNGNITTDPGNPVVIYNGEKIDREAFSKLPAGDIESINVLRDNNLVVVNGKPGTLGTTDIKTNQSFNNLYYSDSTRINNYLNSNTTKGFGNLPGFNDKTNVDFAKGPLIVIDEKEANEKQAKKVSVDDIESMTVLKGRTAIQIYGEKAKNGAIIINTKKTKK